MQNAPGISQMSYLEDWKSALGKYKKQLTKPRRTRSEQGTIDFSGRAAEPAAARIANQLLSSNGFTLEWYHNITKFCANLEERVTKIVIHTTQGKNISQRPETDAQWAKLAAHLQQEMKNWINWFQESYSAFLRQDHSNSTVEEGLCAEVDGLQEVNNNLYKQRRF